MTKSLLSLSMENPKWKAKPILKTYKQIICNYVRIFHCRFVLSDFAKNSDTLYNKPRTDFFINFSFYYRYFLLHIPCRPKHTGKITLLITRPLVHASLYVLISMFSSRKPNFSEAAHTTQKSIWPAVTYIDSTQ